MPSPSQISAGLSKTIAKPTITSVLFEKRLGILGGIRVPFVPPSLVLTHLFAGWKRVFAFKLSEWIVKEFGRRPSS